MALFNYACESCKHKEEHFRFPNSKSKLKCPKCNSDKYTKEPSRFGMIVEYVDQDEFMENRINPMVEETYGKIGAEAANEDTKTLDNLFGEEKVQKSLYGYDD